MSLLDKMIPPDAKLKAELMSLKIDTMFLMISKLTETEDKIFYNGLIANFTIKKDELIKFYQSQIKGSNADDDAIVSEMQKRMGLQGQGK